MNSSKRSDILIVDDEVDIRELVSGILEDEGYSTRLAGDSDSALEEIQNRRPSLVLLDIWLQGSRLDGLKLLEIIKEQHPDLPVVMISGHGNIEMAVSAIRSGAYDFIEKPFKADRLVLVAERALETTQLRREVKELRTKAATDTEIVGNSNVINSLIDNLDRVAKTNSRVLLTGDPGTGKELAARYLHGLSHRSSGPFVSVNAALMDETRWESFLFGTEQTNGGSRQIGALEEAHGGTLYVDEIAEMPIETQGKILRVLVSQNFQRVGGNTRVHVDVRVLTSSSKDLSIEISEGRLREDLFHRLAVVPIRVPSLSERREDIPRLVDHFISQISKASGLPVRKVHADAMAVLQSHDWPGNIRQLRNNIEQILILSKDSEDDQITIDQLPSEIGSQVMPKMEGSSSGDHIMALPLRAARAEFERQYLMAQVSRFGGNISQTAEFVGMERSALHRKLKSLGALEDKNN